ncbi:MAG: UDP-glucose/GDP-mannose dehydrogenase family protein [Myxococcota bacterium]
MKLAIVGAGYVGLVAGACFADVGNTVTMVDRSEERVAAILDGRSPIWEAGLDDLLQAVRERRRLLATTSLAEGIRDADAVFIAVGTPAQADGTADVSAVEAVLESIAEHAGGSHVYVVLKSTVPPGTNERLTQWLAERGISNLELVSNPEFLKQGDAVRDFMGPDRVIVGTRTERATELMRALYGPFMVRSKRLQVMDPTSAEITKYASNAMLASRVSFMNDLARLCEALGADVGSVRRGMGSDSRIGPHFLYASLGYGGSCFPKDVAALSAIGRSVGVTQSLVEATAHVNQVQRLHVLQRALDALGPEPAGKRAAVWGLAFKPMTDDVRESAATALVAGLRDSGVACAVHDPAAVDNALAVLGPEGITVVDDPLDALDGAHVLVIATEWRAYRTPDLQTFANRMANPIIVDGRNIYEPRWFAGTPVTYHSVGRRTTGGDGPRTTW